ncbi:MAG: preprotein translocase subunit SecA, partial [Gammaproteobacteria bacterium]
TDIVLGGNLDEEIAALKDPTPEKIESVRKDWERRHTAVLESGGLHVIGTERHESRRVDNQLRGRSGRQGDPGSSRFYLSLEDNLMRIFASEKVSGMMKKLGMGEGEAIEHPWVTKAISNAQKKVEGHNFEIRKHLIEYDDVSNEQRKVIFEMRQNLMKKDDISDMVDEMWDDVYNAFIDRFIPPQSLYEQWDIEGLQAGLKSEFGLDLPISDWLDQDEHMHEEVLREKIIESSRERYQAKVNDAASREMMLHFEKQVVLRVLDTLWREHINIMEHLRESIYLRSYAQKNPKHEFQSEAFKLFSDLLSRIHHESVSLLSKIQLTVDQDGMSMGDEELDMVAHHDQPGEEEGAGKAEEAQPYVRKQKKVGRNQPCPCGSGKKYKHCHGRLTAPVESGS